MACRKFDNIWRTMSTNWKRNDTKPDADATISQTNMSHYLPNIVVAFNSFSLIMSGYSSLVHAIHYDVTSNTSQPFAHMLILIDLPFNINTQFRYLSVVFLQFLVALLVTAVTMTVNAVLIVMMLYLGDQIDIIRRCLTEISPEYDADLTIVKEIVRKHQRIIAFSNDVESLFTYIAFVVILMNTLISCSLGFILVTAIGTFKFKKILMRFLMFYCVVNIDNFIFCFAGEYISTKSKEIGEAAYYSPWYRSKPHGSIILFLIMRSQNQLMLTMGKFMDLSLERFASIIKTSGSYVSVLIAIMY